MRVNTPGTTGRVTKKSNKSASKTGQGTFSLGQSEGTNSTNVTSSVNSIANVDALIALQGMPDATQERKKAIAQATSMLDVLEDIKLDLLSGQIPKSRLQQLSGMVQNQFPDPQDPKLKSLLEEIELRVKVELAKYE